jgi:hypothetical protein
MHQSGRPCRLFRTHRERQAILCADPRSTLSPGPPAPPARSAARSGATTARPGPSLRSGTAAGRSASPRRPAARDLKHARYALRISARNLTGRQEAKLAWIEKTHPRLWRAYLLKEGLRVVFQLKGEEGNASPAGCPGRPAAASPNSPRPGKDPPAPAQHPRDPRPLAQQWPDRIGEHQDRGHHTDGLRVSTIPPPSSGWPCSPLAASAPPSPEVPEDLFRRI